ncbi:restriction endonuclease subunit S [Escherichia coli]|uniref:restriction endonuclease subunit S n=1 Tax=Escherichia coli TaxID=562 RepID=UPI000F87202E|nr:restriction endonuclease subunit S [Escherichia coli]EFK5448997.1 restriction endonuclease subunit S [Escherichia coli]EHP1053398.1 restriction endonuclease subunit S [Escherichia coli]EHX6282581.1 restriction endonuclease subunit S [Escherichia coli]EJH0874838.1 restriction endonuclease subunit S [Escherichia coli]EJT0343096.1 restriction endonuclease subunit S [Escherichia coli]
MSELNYLEKLLDGVEVEWKTLGSIAELKRGTSITKKDVIDGTIPVVAGGRTPAYYHNTSNRDGQTIVIAGSGAYAGFVSWWEEPIFVSDAFTVKPHNILLPRYCYHFLMNMQQQLHDFKSGGGVPHVYPRDVSPILIPIPCPDNPEKSLAIQSEIVRILDKFTALTAELTAELNMRKKQYNYYRDQLLSFDEGEVEWKALGEVAKIQRGASPRPIVNYLTEQGNGIPWIKIGDTIPGSKYIDKTLQKITAEGAQKSRILNPGDFVISNSMSFGRPYILRITGAIHDGWASISNFGEKLNADYLYHYLSSKKVKNYWESKINSGSVSNLNADIIKTLPVPLPDKQKQERISALLDKFDTLTNSITEGLPREIELRQKQYEYYRDLLFSFPTPETVSN